jgi:hypothetical protein
MQIRFSYETKYGMFSDALNLPDDHQFTEEELTAMKEQRRDNWIAYIDSTQIENTSEIIPEEQSNNSVITTEEIPAEEQTPSDS